MGRHRLEGNPPITVKMRRSARARRLSLRVSRLDGQVTLTMPRFAPEREGVAFLREREDWLRGHLADIAPATDVAIGAAVPFGGEDLPVVAGPGRGCRREKCQIIVNPARPVGPQVKALLREEARRALATASDRYAASLGRSYSRLTLRDTRSRWGSCTSEGALMYSWRLIMAPSEVLDYVAAHEVSHLVEMNHQPPFWAVVAKLCPDWQAHRDWLREHGDRLHRIRFDN
ncbi:MAG: SprT family zinc-dependent metalloprotease [Pseudomonadota bacterium]